MLQAAGILYLTTADQILLIQRSDEGDQVGTWAFPGGKIEEGEDAEEAAIREAKEELGYLAPTKPLEEWTRRVTNGVDFTTFICKIDKPFVPELNEEHTAYQWVDRKSIMPPDGGPPAADPTAHADSEIVVPERHPVVEMAPDGTIKIYGRD